MISNVILKEEQEYNTNIDDSSRIDCGRPDNLPYYGKRIPVLLGECSCHQCTAGFSRL